MRVRERKERLSSPCRVRRSAPIPRLLARLDHIGILNAPGLVTNIAKYGND